MHIFVHNLYDGGTVSVSTSSPSDSTILVYCIYCLCVFYHLATNRCAVRINTILLVGSRSTTDSGSTRFSILQLKIEKLRE